MSKRKERILFVCHGNICRSPMAEYIFKDLIRNDIYPPAKLKLREHGIPYGHHEAHQMTREEYE